MHTPDLVQIHDDYRHRDVQFVALTRETEADLPRIDNFARQLNVPWPIAYGASLTINALEVSAIPTTFVIGRDGNVVWNSFQMGTLRAAIDQAL